MPFLGDCAVRHMAAVLERFERELYPALAARRTAMPVVPAGARHSTLNINSIHGGQPDGRRRPARPAGGRLLPHGDRPPAADRGETSTSVKARGARRCSTRSPSERPGFRYSMRDMFEVRPPWPIRDGPVVRAPRAAVRRVLGREPAFDLLARHLRPEAHRPHRQAARLHRLRSGHPRSRAPAG